MTNACRACNRSITQNCGSVSCSDCAQTFHGTCVIPKVVLGNSEKWKCTKCIKKAQKTTVSTVVEIRKFSGTKKVGPTTINEVYGVFLELKRDLKNFQAGLLESIKRLHDKIESNSKCFDDQNKKLASCFEIIESLKAENESLRRDIDVIKRKQTESDQRLRMNDLEIRGVPHQPHENIVGVVQSLAVALHSLLLFDENCIVFCYRAQQKSEDSPGTIHVRFAHYAYKEDLLRRRCSIRGFNSRQMALPVTSDQSVFVNESLCPERRVLFKKANQLRKEKHYRYIWTREGRILVRRSDTCPVLAITCLADLSKL